MTVTAAISTECHHLRKGCRSLSQTLDRSLDKNLLKGKVGYVDSWVEDEKEDSAFDQEKRILRYVPQVVFVQFYERVWTG